MEGYEPASGTEAGASVQFDRRVRVLVEIIDDPDEIALAEEVLRAHGWPVREASASEQVGCATECRALVVEIRLVGLRDVAVRRALGHIDRVAAAASLSMWAHDAVLIEHAPAPYTEWHIGPVDDSTKPIERAIRVPGDPSIDAALATLTDRNFGTRPIDMSGPYALPPAARGVDAEKRNIKFIWGASALVGLALFVPVVGSGVWDFVAAPILVFAVVWVGMGTRLALRGSSVVRTLVWVLPLVAPLFLPVTTWVGTLVHERYLAYFAIPPDSVHVAITDRLWAGARLVIGVVCFGLLGLATHGWLRESRAAPEAADTGELLQKLGIGLMVGTSLMLTPLTTGMTPRLQSPDILEAVRVGRAPAAYYGLRPSLICVAPASEKQIIPAYNGPSGWTPRCSPSDRTATGSGCGTPRRASR